jgi:hypothetical protein
MEVRGREVIDEGGLIGVMEFTGAARWNEKQEKQSLQF